MNPRLFVPLALLAAPLAAQQQVDVKPPAAPPPMVDADRKTPAPLPPVKAMAAPSASRSQGPVVEQETKPVTGKNVAPRMPEDMVLVDRPGDGKVWARTRQYKASFGGAGASY